MTIAQGNRLFPTFAACLLLLVAAGCGGQKEEPARTAQTAGDQPPAHTQTAAPAEGETATAGLLFTVPDGWAKEEPTSTMRLGEWRVPSGEDGVDDGEVALFHFGPGRGGDVQSNLARWAGQFQQEDGSSGMDHAKLANFESNGLQIHTIELDGRYVSNMPGGARSYNEAGWRLMGGIVEGDGGPWFFKGVGPEKVMLQAQDDFLGLLKSAHTG